MACQRPTGDGCIAFKIMGTGRVDRAGIQMTQCVEKSRCPPSETLPSNDTRAESAGTCFVRWDYKGSKMGIVFVVGITCDIVRQQRTFL